MDRSTLTQRRGAGRQIVESYGEGGFKVSGLRHVGSVLIFPDRTVPWVVAAVGEVTFSSLEAVLARASRPRILVVGCGRAFEPRPADLASALREVGIVLEWMDTPAACRTYDVLLLEDREVAAALIAVA